MPKFYSSDMRFPLFIFLTILLGLFICVIKFRNDGNNLFAQTEVLTQQIKMLERNEAEMTISNADFKKKLSEGALEYTKLSDNLSEAKNQLHLKNDIIKSTDEKLTNVYHLKEQWEIEKERLYNESDSTKRELENLRNVIENLKAEMKRESLPVNSNEEQLSDKAQNKKPVHGGSNEAETNNDYNEYTIPEKVKNTNSSNVIAVTGLKNDEVVKAIDVNSIKPNALLSSETSG